MRAPRSSHQVAENGRDGVVAQPVGHGELIVEVPDLLHGGLEHLGGTVGVGGVLGRQPAEHLAVFLDELGIAGGVCARARG